MNIIIQSIEKTSVNILGNRFFGYKQMACKLKVYLALFTVCSITN